jgi:hypothetical protein
LTGSDLDSAHGKAYVAETMTNLKGVHDNSKTIFNLKLVGEDLHYDFGEEPIPDGIGFLGKYREIDYVLDKGIKYSSKEGSIELGLYGPFRLEGKFESHSQRGLDSKNLTVSAYHLPRSQN